MAMALHAPRQRELEQSHLDRPGRQARGPSKLVNVDGGWSQRRQQPFAVARPGWSGARLP